MLPCLQTRHNSTQDFQKRMKLRDDAVPTVFDPMSQHKSVSNSSHYVITMALSVITDILICTEYRF